MPCFWITYSHVISIAFLIQCKLCNCDSSKNIDKVLCTFAMEIMQNDLFQTCISCDSSDFDSQIMKTQNSLRKSIKATWASITPGPLHAASMQQFLLKKPHLVLSAEKHTNLSEGWHFSSRYFSVFHWSKCDVLGFWDTEVWDLFTCKP